MYLLYVEGFSFIASSTASTPPFNFFSSVANVFACSTMCSSFISPIYQLSLFLTLASKPQIFNFITSYLKLFHNFCKSIICFSQFRVIRRIFIAVSIFFNLVRFISRIHTTFILVFNII